MDRSRLAVVIPAYNEAATIFEVVSAAAELTNVIVVDDCSSDATASLANDAGALVVRNSRNLGYDATLTRGIVFAAEAGHRHIVTMDADGEHSTSVLGQFHDALVDRQIPLVLGVRARKQRWSESLMSWYVRMRFGASDILCGMKGYHASLIQGNEGLGSVDTVGTGFALHALRRGARFVEIPVVGKVRQGTPRFGISWRANMRILGALRQAIKEDIRQVGRRPTV